MFFVYKLYMYKYIVCIKNRCRYRYTCFLSKFEYKIHKNLKYQWKNLRAVIADSIISKHINVSTFNNAGCVNTIGQDSGVTLHYMELIYLFISHE